MADARRGIQEGGQARDALLALGADLPAPVRDALDARRPVVLYFLRAFT